MNISALWLSLLLGQAQATRARYQELPCPLPTSAGEVVRVYTLVSGNTQGGYDSDTATYASDGQFREYAVATCAESLFSLYGEDMAALSQEGLAADQTAILKAALQAAVARLPDPANPAVWERYAIAAQIYAAMDRPPLQIAEVYLQASWTARDTVVGFHQGLEGPGAVAWLLEAGPRELEKPLTLEQRRTVLYSLARAAHRGGYSAERDAFLRQFEQAGPLTAEERAAVAEFRHIVGEVEPRYQDLALEWLGKALKDPKLAAGEQLRATYLTADLLRRRGRPSEARPLYQAVADDPQASASLRSMASLLLQELGG